MACNGWNHASTCDCDFGSSGGKYSADEVANARLVPDVAHTARPTTCRKCGEAAYYVGNRRGGTLVDTPYFPWPKHFCTDQRWLYSAFNRDGKPKLRNKADQLSKRGFKPIWKAWVRSRDGKTIVEGTWVMTPSNFELVFDSALAVDVANGTFLKWQGGPNAVFSYKDIDDGLVKEAPGMFHPIHKADDDSLV